MTSWIKYTHAAPSPFNIIHVLVWQQTLLSYTLISATIPNLKAFLQSLSTNWGIDWGYSSNAYGTNGTFELSNIKRSGAGASHAGSEAHYPSQTRGAKFTTTVNSTGRDQVSVGSHDSQDLIIRKDTQWVVQSERAESSQF